MDRSTKLKKVFDGVLRGSIVISPQRSADFLDAITAHDDPADCISRMMGSKEGLNALQACMRYDLTSNFLNRRGADVVTYLLDPRLKEIAGGLFLQQVLIKIVDPPIFWLAFVAAFRGGKLEEKGQIAFAGLFLQLLSFSDVDKNHRDLADDSPFMNLITDSPILSVRSLGAKIISFINATSTSIIHDSGSFKPGGRHDNDFADFREIAVLPTAAEISSTETPFLRASDYLDNPETLEQRVEIYLDSQFRLLRDDMIHELREEVQIALNQKKGFHRGLVLSGFHLVDMHTGPDDRRCKWGITLQCETDPWIFKRVKPKDRKVFLDDNRTRYFRHQSLACLLVNDEIIAFPTLNRDENLLAKKPSVLVLQLEGNLTAQALAKLKLADSRNIRVILIDTAVFSFEPILKAIKDAKEIPLSSEILFWNEGDVKGPVDVDSRLQNVVSSLRPQKDLQTLLATSKPIILDVSQHASLNSALTQKLSLIQGPPGTGKSFIGALVAKIIHDFSPQTILVVCYTNHALDQFLEDLLDIGIPEAHLVRLGGKSTPRTAPVALSSLQKQRLGPKLTKLDWTQIDALKVQASKLCARLQADFKRYSSMNIHLGHILGYLEYADDDDDIRFYDALSVPQTNEGGMTSVGRGGKAVGSTYLIESWVKNRSPGIFRDHPQIRSSSDIWNMHSNDRQRCITRWRTGIIREITEKIHSSVQQYNTCLSQIDEIFAGKDGELVGSRRIIGCTTTAAAKYNEIIRTARPDVLLVEEAGEILESHVLTSLNPNSKQIILIGDHKQLRPKVNNYRLTVEKGEGYDLNVSLFERLVLKGYPHETLLEQHRMRPEISSLIRELTYPDLVDAPKTQNRPPYEDELPDVMDRQDLTATSSKENTYEVEMVLKTVRYLAQQGYRTEEMTILTPYLGQLQKLRKSLAADTDPVLNDLDTHDLVRAGLVPAATASVAKRKIRLATIDNYQGEESDIIIASLTRSNANRDIGFLYAPERLNVLLSRARNGLIMIGNSETFSTARRGSDLWTKFFSLLKRGRHVYEGLPIKCERHPDRMALLRKAVDFDTETPDGGCLEDCGTMLKCGVHACPSKCHQLSDHSKMPCEAIVESKCPKNHKQSWRCSEGPLPSCKKCDQEAAEVKRKQQQALETQRKREAQKAAYDRELREINEKIEAGNEAARSAEEERKRQEVLAQRRRDLEEITVRNTSTPTASQSPSLLQPILNRFSPTTSTIPVDSSSSVISPVVSIPPVASPVVPSTATIASVASDVFQSAPLTTSPSAAEQEWQRQKDFEGASNDAIDSLMKLTGLEEVKLQVLAIKAKIDLVTRQNTSVSKERFNVCMLGNPGTGKTTVSRSYAKFLSSVGILPGNEFIETTGSRIANDGIPGIKAHIEAVLNAGGGAIFIDEAYQLVSTNSLQGSQVLDFVLAEMENNVGKLVFILAGYHKEMEKFFEHNPGLSSRVPYVLNFEDFTDDELLKMLKRLIEEKYQGKMKIDGGVEGLFARVVVRRLGRGRNRPGFGNARALENVFNKITERQAKRISIERKNGQRPDDFLLTREDLIGPEPSGALEQSVSWKKLQDLIGLSSVKETVRSLIDTLHTNYLRELKETKPIEVSLNRVMTGSSGTGKTTVAKYYGQILADLGLLSNGEVVVKNPADFTGAHLGQSEEKTKAILASTVGKVLVIDEAYGLYGGSQSSSGPDIYKTAVIDTIVAEVQSVAGEDRCVLLLGYRPQMEEMFQNVNPGLSRRFAIEDAFQFDDFSESELMEVLELKLRQSDLDASDDAKTVAREYLGRARSRPNFGNGGDVQNLIDKAKIRYQSRQASLPKDQRSADIVLQPIDFDPEHDRQNHASSNLAKLFENLEGCDEVVQKLGSYQQLAIGLKNAGKDPRKHVPTCFIFKGPPGTGKTTVAREMGQVFYDMGFLSTKEVVECSASDLVGQYVGQTGPKVQKKFEQALGRVLFIDEAYRLGEGHFAQEAVDEIVSILTQEKFMSKLVVILAGYDNDMNRLLAVNTGLSSRFPETITFHNMDHTSCLKVLEKVLKDEDILIADLQDRTSLGYHEMASILDELAALPGWGNIRDVMTLSKKMIGEAYSSSPPQLTGKRASSIMKDMVAERQNRSTNSRSPPSHQAESLAQPPRPRFTPSISTAAPPTTLKKPNLLPPQDEAGTSGRDTGVSDAEWNQLQHDKKVAEKLEQERHKRMLELERQVQEQKAQEEKEAALLENQRKEAARARDAAEQSELKRQHEAMRLRALQAQAERRKLEEALEAQREEQKKEAQAQQ
ncbi:P-loop containing nucleoside triphosphate hydrolase protein [Rhodocollybia butyracea]|uniref:P-loop containing nucleoside triphosphate hydrolase protein n=1 Tax=Rhodocollybia butyracea TaxID=206335 RepID=A0A9P5Q959_9AGAR|nr:P-loop containing nucleoside triphosphate hydrolase protein [Rhodocollybia butyracea]